jgi:hypothetical protein
MLANHSCGKTCSTHDVKLVGKHVTTHADCHSIQRLCCRIDTAVINSTTDNIIIEDERDTELRYSSGANLLCAAAPLVEAMPDALLGCSSNASLANATTPAGPAHMSGEVK